MSRIISVSYSDRKITAISHRYQRFIETCRIILMPFLKFHKRTGAALQMLFICLKIFNLNLTTKNITRHNRNIDSPYLLELTQLPCVSNMHIHTSALFALFFASLLIKIQSWLATVFREAIILKILAAVIVSFGVVNSFQI